MALLSVPAILILDHAGLANAVLGKKRALRMVGQNEKRSARTKMRTAVSVRIFLYLKRSWV